MANPLKVLTQLQVSGALNTSGSLSVGGGGSLTVANGLTVSSGSVTLPNGTVANAALANSSVTIGSTSVALGATATTVAGLTSLSATSLTGSLSGSDLVAASVENSKLVNSSVTVTAGDGLTGGGSVSLGGSTSVALSSSVAGDGLGFSSGVLSVNVDASTIEINSDTLRVKDAGITNAKLNSEVAGNGLTGGAGAALAVGQGTHITVSANDVAVNTTTLVPAITASIFGGVSGDILIDSAGIATIQANSVALGTDTTGNYVADVTAGAGLKKTSSASEGQTVDLSIETGTGINVTADGVAVKTGSVALSDGDLLKWDGTGFAKSKITEDANGVSVAGNLTVSGYVTGTVVRIDTTNTVVKDQFLYLNSGSQGINGTEGGIKIAVSGAAGEKEGQLSYVSGSGFKVTDGSITGAESNSSLTALADFTAKALYFSASAASPYMLYSSGLNSVQSVIDAIGVGFGAGSIQKDGFYGIRTSGFATKGAGENVTFTLSETASAGADRSAGRSGQTTPDAILPQIQGLTSVSSSVVLDRLAFVSFDVAVKAAGSSVWTNDLCSVEVSAVDTGGGDFYPRVTVSAPALASGSLVRLITVWEDFNKIS